jgi:ubiquinone/menaquinone biosynthesis C-methylase UbiE
MGTDREWEAFGKSDPYFGVLTHARFRAAATDSAARDEFFSLGEKHVEHFLSIIKENLDPTFAPHRALDFGCGVGRITIPLARYVGQVVALDVSDSMLMEAKRNCVQAGIQNVTLLKSDDRLTKLSGSFDFLHSFIVFQHIPRQRGEAILNEMLRHLADNGVGALHFTYASRASQWRRVLGRVRATVPYVQNFVNLAKGRSFRYPHMQMNDYKVNQLLLLLQQHGCHRVHIRFSDHGGYLGIVLFFKKEALPLL